MTKNQQFRLGDLIKRRKDAIFVLPDHTYSRVTIRTNHGGVSVRDTISGTEINTERQFVVSSGQFIVSKIDARNGAFGIVPGVCDGAIITGNFWVFDVAYDLLVSDYLRYFVQTDSFSELCVSASDGTTNRRYLDEHKFLNSHISLPELSEQHRIVCSLDAASAAMQARKRIADAVEAELTDTLKTAFRHIVSDAPRARMRDVAPLVRRPVNVDPERKYPELGVRSFGKGTFHKPELSGFEIGSKRLFRIEAGDLLFNIVFAWEGAVAVATEDDDGRVGSHRFLTCVPDARRASSQFLRYFFLTEDGLQQLGQASPGGAGRNRTLGLEALNAIDVPIAPLEAQRWFDMLQAKAAAARASSGEAAREMQRLIPAMLSQSF